MSCQHPACGIDTQTGDLYCLSCGETSKEVIKSLWGGNYDYKPPTLLNADDTQPIKNDGERCVYCGKANKVIQMITSVTRYCPSCEGKSSQPKSANITDGNEIDWADVTDDWCGLKSQAWFDSHNNLKCRREGKSFADVQKDLDEIETYETTQPRRKTNE